MIDPSNLSRRGFLATGAAASTLSAAPVFAKAAEWRSGEVVHIVPTANHERIRIKCSLSRRYANGIALRVNGKAFPGERSDTAGQYWTFDVAGLAPDTIHQLVIEEKGRALCDPWPLKTFPLPDAAPRRFRLLTFTCAGGHEGARGSDGAEVFRPLAIRRRLLARGLSFSPDAVIANGDHIYWDQRSAYDAVNPAWRKTWQTFYQHFKPLDRAARMFGTVNEEVMKSIGDPQIVGVYGNSLRSVPSFFLGDDHDYFENDEANEKYVTFPPDDFMVRAKQAIQQLYYPEMLPDATRPTRMSGTLDNGLSESFGTLRYGTLFEALLYDCGRFMDLKGEFGRIVPEEVEDWLIARTKATDTRQLIHVPSHPPGWSAGKWREWYPDVVEELNDADGGGGAKVVHFQSFSGPTRLTADKPKFMWQPGWFKQHQRLMEALAANRQRPGVFVSGDLHAVGWERIIRAGDVDMRENPVHTVLSGPISSSTWAWPSKARGLSPALPTALTVDAGDQPVERNGFTIIDVEPERMTFRLFGWNDKDGPDAIDTMEPWRILQVATPDSRS